MPYMNLHFQAAHNTLVIILCIFIRWDYRRRQSERTYLLSHSRIDYMARLILQPHSSLKSLWPHWNMHLHPESHCSSLWIFLRKWLRTLMLELYRSRYQRILYTALLVFMYHACLSVSEVAIAKHNRHTLEFADVKCRNNYVVINFRTFKHSKGQTVSLKIAATHDVCCPVSALSKYLSKRGTVSGPIFIKENGKPLTRSNVASALQQSLRPTVRNPERYNTHSFRIGKITGLACIGYTNAKMQKIDRWRSSTAMQRYIKRTRVHVP